MISWVAVDNLSIWGGGVGMLVSLAAPGRYKYNKNAGKTKFLYINLTCWSGWGISCAAH